jgi:hypothetical protein
MMIWIGLESVFPILTRLQRHVIFGETKASRIRLSGNWQDEQQNR